MWLIESEVYQASNFCHYSTIIKVVGIQRIFW